MASAEWENLDLNKMFLSCNINDIGASISLFTKAGSWWAFESVTTVLERAETYNRRIIFDENTILKTLKYEKPIEATYKDVSAGKIILKLRYKVQSKIRSCPFNFEWQMRTQTHGEFRTLTLKPVVDTVNDLNRQVAELCGVIARKDAEIKQYKIEAGPLRRKTLQTRPFDLNSFKQKNIHLTENIEIWNSLFNSCKSSDTKDNKMDGKGEASTSAAKKETNSNAAGASSSNAAGEGTSPRNRKRKIAAERAALMKKRLAQRVNRLQYEDSQSQPSVDEEAERKQQKIKKPKIENDSTEEDSSSSETDEESTDDDDDDDDDDGSDTNNEDKDDNDDDDDDDDDSDGDTPGANDVGDSNDVSDNGNANADANNGDGANANAEPDDYAEGEQEDATTGAAKGANNCNAKEEDMTVDEEHEQADVEDEQADVEDEQVDVEDEQADVEDEQADVEDEQADVEDEQVDVEDEQADVEDVEYLLSPIPSDDDESNDFKEPIYVPETDEEDEDTSIIDAKFVSKVVTSEEIFVALKELERARLLQESNFSN